MKKLLTLALLGVFGATIAGCEASASVQPDRTRSSVSTDGGTTSSKTTTVRDANGNVIERDTVRRANP